MYITTESLTVYRWVARLGWPRRWLVVALGTVLILIPIVLAYWEVGAGLLTFYTNISGRHLFFFPLMITYLLAIMGPLQSTREGVAQALRPLVDVDDEQYVSVVNQACRVNPMGELIAIAVGALFFLGIEGPYAGGSEYPVLSLYTYLAGLIMFATISWSIYGVLKITRLANEILHLPVQIDIFDIEALEPIGRQSLFLALTFVGATLLSLFFVVPSDNLRDFFSLENILIYSILIVVTLTVFYLNMHRTHSPLATAKKQQIKLTDHNLSRGYHRLQDLIASEQETDAVSRELSALAASKQQLLVTRTWPYDTGMLRTLFVSILTPLAVGFLRVVLPLLMN